MVDRHHEAVPVRALTLCIYACRRRISRQQSAVPLEVLEVVEEIELLRSGRYTADEALTAVYEIAKRITARYGDDGYVLSRAIVRDMVPMEQAASMIGYVTMGMSVVPMVGPTVGGLLNDISGWQSSFALLSLLGVGILLNISRDEALVGRVTMPQPVKKQG